MRLPRHSQLFLQPFASIGAKGLKPLPEAVRERVDGEPLCPGILLCLSQHLEEGRCHHLTKTLLFLGRCCKERISNLL